MKVCRPNLPSWSRLLLFRRIGDILDSECLTNHGPLVREFEKAIQDRLNVRNSVCVCNGTVGLQVALRACGNQHYDDWDTFGFDVEVPSWTFPATVQAVTWMGLIAGYADVGEGHGFIGGAAIDVRLWGRADLTTNVSGAKPFIIDSAHAFGTQGVGSSGSCEVFSFHANKLMSTFGEGGCITTQDDELAVRCRRLIRFGFDPDESGRQFPEQCEPWGTNGKMTEVQAAYGLVMLEELDAIIARNRESYERYVEGLNGLPVDLLEHPEGSNCSYIVIETERRDEIMLALREQGIESKRYFWPGCHKLPIRGAYAAGPLPNTERLAARTLVLPHADSEKEVRRIAEVIETVLERQASF